jgi:L-amino acid N-acyltransferase YncA
MSMTIRLATEQDAEQILEIYAPFCLRTPVSFETQPPALAEMRARIAKTLDSLPWLVCEEHGQILGYAYASRHRERAGYRWSVDVSVYIREGHRGAGLGRALYIALFAILRLQGFYNIVAGISLPNPASVKLHESMGLQPIGTYPGIGFKCGQWHDVGWWQLSLRTPTGAPEEPLELAAVRTLPEFNEAIMAGLARLDRTSPRKSDQENRNVQEQTERFGQG